MKPYKYKMNKLPLLTLLFQALLATIPTIPILPNIPLTFFNQLGCAPSNPTPRLPTGFVKLKSYDGDFLCACINCGPGSYPDSAAFGSE